jgi:hypothetical protein
MNLRIAVVLIITSVMVWSAIVGVSQEPAPKEETAAEQKSAESIPQARDRAKLLHKVYAASMEVMHDRYFRNDRDTIPARAMEDVFTEMKRQAKIQSRWIGVNAKVMSINHEPKDDFEKFAAKELSEGKDSVERIEGNLYRRAEAIHLSSGCLTCHGTFGIEPKTPRVAGLVIGIPVRE